MTLGAKCCFTFLMLITQILLHGVVGLVLYWVWMFHNSENDDGEIPWHPFAWREDPRKEFNLHPVLMIVGFVYCMGQSMLMYRSCRCCRRIANKLLHTVFHLLAMPCIALAFVAVWDSHNLRTVQNSPAPIPNFYSLHSWMGLATMGLFALQFIVGFFSFLLLLCCESATASFRANLVPIHSTFGITTFVMAIATACSGLTEKAFFTLSIGYKEWVKFAVNPSLWSVIDTGEYKKDGMFAESIVINTLGAALIALLFTVPILLLYPKFRYRPQRIITVTTHHKGTHDRYA